MKKEIVLNQIQGLCKSLNFAPAISLVKCHKLDCFAITHQELINEYHLTVEFISKMNRIKTDSYFGGDTGEEYLYLLQEAIFLELVMDKEYSDADLAEAMEMYNRGITITV